jgi:hypothetical protein
VPVVALPCQCDVCYDNFTDIKITVNGITRHKKENQNIIRVCPCHEISRLQRALTPGTVQIFSTAAFMQPLATADTLNPVTFITALCVKTSTAKDTTAIIIILIITV